MQHNDNDFVELTSGHMIEGRLQLRGRCLLRLYDFPLSISIPNPSGQVAFLRKNRTPKGALGEHKKTFSHNDSTRPQILALALLLGTSVGVGRSKKVSGAGRARDGESGDLRYYDDVVEGPPSEPRVSSRRTEQYVTKRPGARTDCGLH